MIILLVTMQCAELHNPTFNQPVNQDLVVTLVKHKSWKLRMDPGWDPRDGFGFQG